MKGVVAAGHSLTADAAARILRGGGNAFDAAIAGIIAACTPEFVLSSVGGGGFLMAYGASDNETVLYDFFTQTPLCARSDGQTDLHGITADFGPATQEFHIGAGTTATPGLVPGLATVHAERARLPWPDLFGPAIEYARAGVQISAFQAYLFTVIGPILTANEDTRKLFAPEGHLLRAGQIFANPRFADTLVALAAEGPERLRSGDLARAIVRQSQNSGGHLTLDDLQNYKVARRRPLELAWHDAEVALNPAPAAGGIMVGLGLGALGARPVTPENLIQAQEAGNAARDEMNSDPAALSAHPILLECLQRTKQHPPASRGTTHISVIDSDGNAAAATISNGEGNGLMLEETGIMLNNMLGEEDINPEGLGSWQPGLRLSSMMAPTILKRTDGSLIALGSGGSNRIRSALVQVIARHVAAGQPLQEAIEAPRLHLEKDGHLDFEDFFPENIRSSLIRAYPNAKAWAQRNMFFGGTHVACRDADGRLFGFGDPRRGGVTVLVD